MRYRRLPSGWALANDSSGFVDMRVWLKCEKALRSGLVRATGSGWKAVIGSENSPQKHMWRARIVLLNADGIGRAPPHSPDLNPIEQVFSKLKTPPRRTDPRCRASNAEHEQPEHSDKAKRPGD